MLMDKDSFYEYARKKGLPVPVTYYLDTRSDAAGAAIKLEFPCLLKPRARTATWNKNTKAKAFKVESEAQLLELFDHEDRWPSIRNAGRDFVEHERNWTNSVANLKAVYQRLVPGE